MGKGKKGKKTGSRFLELKSSIVNHLKEVHALIEEQSASKRNNPKEAIAAQADIRELIRQASDEWSELNDLYKKEARKKKSKVALGLFVLISLSWPFEASSSSHLFSPLLLNLLHPSLQWKKWRYSRP